MKKILLGILLTVIAAVTIILIIAATRPNVFQVHRSIVINAAPATITPHITDFRKWAAWSPYEKIDPAMKKTYGGAVEGKGATYEWKGNSDIGSGRMEITDVTPSKISINLDFSEPMESNNTADFTLAPEGKSTKVTWAMEGPYQFIGKVMSVFMDMDKMVGKDFETGLRNLKERAEK